MKTELQKNSKEQKLHLYMTNTERWKLMCLFVINMWYVLKF